MMDNNGIRDKPLDGSKDTSDMSALHRRRFSSEFFLKHSCLLSY